MSYGYIGSMKATPGNRDAVVSILLSGVDGLRALGCLAYVVSHSDTDPDTIWVTEIWRSQQEHDDSLKLPEVQASIGAVMPMLTGEFTRQDVTVIGGLGIPPSH
jgi:quinol monooxygenase YgiN